MPTVNGKYYNNFSISLCRSLLYVHKGGAMQWNAWCNVSVHCKAVTLTKIHSAMLKTERMLLLTRELETNRRLLVRNRTQNIIRSGQERCTTQYNKSTALFFLLVVFSWMMIWHYLWLCVQKAVAATARSWGGGGVMSGVRSIIYIFSIFISIFWYFLFFCYTYFCVVNTVNFFALNFSFFYRSSTRSRRAFSRRAKTRTQSCRPRNSISTRFF